MKFLIALFVFVVFANGQPLDGVTEQPQADKPFDDKDLIKTVNNFMEEMRARQGRLEKTEKLLREKMESDSQLYTEHVNFLSNQLLQVTREIDARRNICPKNWFKIGAKKCVKQFEFEVYFARAETYCTLIGARLLRIESFAETEAITKNNLIKKSTWLDMKFDAVSESYKRLDSSVVEYYNWAASEPRDSINKIHVRINSNGEWTTSKNDGSYFACEKNIDEKEWNYESLALQ